MKKLNLSRYPNINKSITYFQSQYDNDNIDNIDYEDVNIDEPLNYFQSQLNDYQKLNLNQDVLYELLLNSDDLTNLCYLNKTTQQICQSKAFWDNKVDYPFFIHRKNLQHQLQEYVALEKAEKQVLNIIKDVDYMVQVKYKNQMDQKYKNVIIKLVDELFFLFSNDINHLDEKLNDLLYSDSENFKTDAILLLIELFYSNQIDIAQQTLNIIYQSILK